ncbi:two-component sensor histidine kinase [Mycetocola zhadangensis]|nr:two-component sensor histidine kinase [Mycetocola zhadangensis]
MLLDVLLGLAATALVPFRHHAPLAITLMVGIIGSISYFALGAVIVTIISLATRRRARELAVLAVVILVVTVLAEAWISSTILAPIAEPAVWWQVTLVMAVALAVLIVTGLYIGGRRELIKALVQRSELLEEEQALRLEQARSAERSAIAREMHDVLAHRLSLVAMHSGGLAWREDLSREQSAATAAVVQENARLALAELRGVLGVLRAPSAETNPDALTPQPSLGVLDELLAESTQAGLAVHCEIAPDIAPVLSTLSSVQSRHAYRIVQEALTNARRHAPGSRVEVTLGGTPGTRLELKVRNRLSQPRESEALNGARHRVGMGLTGMTERARLAGGELVHGVVGSDFVVEAWLPWTN